MEILKELYLRRALVLKCIQLIGEVPADDPRREGALMEYNRQKAMIDEKITAIEGKPPPTVIGLKPAVLFAESKGAKK